MLKIFVDLAPAGVLEKLERKTWDHRQTNSSYGIKINILMSYFSSSLIFKQKIRCNLLYIKIAQKTSLLLRLQAHTLSNTSPPIGKIHLFREIAVSLEPVMQFGSHSFE